MLEDFLKSNWLHWKIDGVFEIGSVVHEVTLFGTSSTSLDYWRRKAAKSTTATSSRSKPKKKAKKVVKLSDYKKEKAKKDA